MHPLHNTGKKLWLAGQIRKARENMAAAAKQGENSWKFHSDYASVLTLSGAFDEALDHIEQANASEEFTDGPFRRGMIHLLRGEYEQGWPLYMTRQNPMKQQYPATQWDGSPLPDGTILLYTDQGIGDAIQFVRYAPVVKERCAHLKLLCRPHFTALLSTAFAFDEVIDNRIPTAADFDRWASLTELPGILGTFVGGWPPPAPATFTVPPAKVAAWQQKLDEQPGHRVGVVWRGSSGNPLYPVRDIPAIYFRPLSRVSGVRLVTLQQQTDKEEVRKVGSPKMVTDLTEYLDSETWGLMDTAAIIQNLELVVTCDTMVAHLAASLGKETWILLAQFPDWRWGTAGNASPWYPGNVRLFRQPEVGLWEAYIRTIVAKALDERFNPPAGAP